jgi:molybdopterin converting factor small subunit
VAIVHFSSTLARHTGGVEQITIDAPRVRELIAALVMRFPGLEPEIDQLAIAIDGDVRPDAAFEPLMPLSEVYFVPKIAGGCSECRGFTGIPT